VYDSHLCYDTYVISIEQFLLVAESVLGIDADRLKSATKIGSAESADKDVATLEGRLTQARHLPFEQGNPVRTRALQLQHCPCPADKLFVLERQVGPGVRFGGLLVV
jgi:hypothetical protein